MGLITTIYGYLFPVTSMFLFHMFLCQTSETPIERTTTTATPQASFQVHIEQKDSRSSKMQIIQRTIRQENYRLERLRNRAPAPTPNPSIQTSVHQAEGEFIMNLSIGTPSRRYSAIMDTGSDLIWTQCRPCKSCYVQPTPIFNPHTSSSFSVLSCSDRLCFSDWSQCGTERCYYRAKYGDHSFTTGYLATETFTIGNISIPKLGFGCGDYNGGVGLDIVAGIVGLGRGPLSLISQLKVKKFSYCLPEIGRNRKGTLSFGALADKDFNSSNYRGTPLLKNPILPSFYYIPLEGISLDDILLPISRSIFELKVDGSGGTILDSGTTVTYLAGEAYKVLRHEIPARTKLSVVFSHFTSLDLCFRRPAGRSALATDFPKLKFHFNGLVLELPKENYMVGDRNLRVVCLGILPSPTKGSIFGTMQQQNFLIRHDLKKHFVSFFPTPCG